MPDRDPARELGDLLAAYRNLDVYGGMLADRLERVCQARPNIHPQAVRSARLAAAYCAEVAALLAAPEVPAARKEGTCP